MMVASQSQPGKVMGVFNGASITIPPLDVTKARDLIAKLLIGAHLAGGRFFP